MNTALDSRARFEALAMDRGYSVVRHAVTGEYLDGEPRFAWEAWQAAIASMWLPIATAPRHGRILVAGTEIGACVASAGWDNETPEIIRWEVVNGITVNPTHWQPITPPIAALAAKE